MPGLVFHRCSSNGRICQNLQGCDDQGILALPCLPFPCKTEKKKKEKLNHNLPHSPENAQGQAVDGGHIYHSTTSVVICKDKWTQQAESFCSEGYDNEDTIRHDPWPIVINLQGNSSLPEKLVTQCR